MKKDDVRVCGVVTELKTKFDKSGRTMAFFTLDDLTGSCECLMFSKAYDEFGKFVE
ncbi:MAG: OB-fold nucleic acid binding domain-containing protein [Ignavibacteriales bacterium]|nr:OB-fold nucleic acid binding domain-containing protein [Ignavibacteriales bacterium]